MQNVWEGNHVEPTVEVEAWDEECVSKFLFVIKRNESGQVRGSRNVAFTKSMCFFAHFVCVSFFDKNGVPSRGVTPHQKPKFWCVLTPNVGRLDWFGV